MNFLIYKSIYYILSSLKVTKMAVNHVSGVEIPNEMIVQIPITANKHLSCLACVRANRDGKYLYVTIMHNKPTDSIIAELRCSHCNQLQENP